MTRTSMLVVFLVVGLVALVALSVRAETPDSSAPTAARSAAAAPPSRPPAPVLLSVEAIPDPPASARSPGAVTNHGSDASSDVHIGVAAVRPVAAAGTTR